MLVLTCGIAQADRPFFFLDWVNLAFHEAGHIFLMPFGHTLHILGGTLMQLFVPLLLIGYFLVKRNPFAASLCAWWLGESVINVATYMADAREMRLELVGGGEHDWTQLFYQFGLLGPESVQTVSSLTHHAGVVVMLAATLWTAGFALPTGTRQAIGERIAERVPLLSRLAD
jgi:hypothetical protein